MESAGREIKEMDKHLKEGLSILARIIARDFMTTQAVNEPCKSAGENNEHFQNK